MNLCYSTFKLLLLNLGGIFDIDNDGNGYSASEIAFKMAIAEINADAGILNGTTLEGISNTTEPLDIKQSVDSGNVFLEPSNT